MPRNRHERQREDKVEEIVELAAEVVRAGGYDALSVNDIAAQIGVARGAVYWYFPSKDHLFAAAAARAVRDVLAGPPPTGNHTRQIVWAVEQLASLRPVHTALQDRARGSEPVAEVLGAIQRAMERDLRAILRGRVAPNRLDAVTKTIFIFVQGLLALPLSGAARQRRLRFLVTQLVDRADPAK